MRIGALGVGSVCGSVSSLVLIGRHEHSGTCAIAASPARVFEALTDPPCCSASFPAAKTWKTGDDEYSAHLKIGIASVKGAT